ncbi:Acetyltransferase BOT5 [Colletotrichum orbiculare MAFF 240422]|uniref:Acetyltransferase BOT5 n=1 Tax=Colletotrichum orbiculare (strain 104-T / ATCC 96160 / CBS 514.97 / LARS 414 / MAFF 240422) TaxID=1213857 RepID=N4V761_COLOR|nr:Acetyltransferase BOT5 [Colletotrichum orbiculare MAFF 240422]
MGRFRSLLSPLLGPERRQPDPIPTDTVIRLSAMDSSWMMRMMIMSWSMCFHDVLDADMLHSSLCELLSIGHWKKLGGRPRLTKSGKIELHIPQSFTPSRPAVHFTTEPNPSSVKFHPLSSTMPSHFPSGGPRIIDTPETLHAILAGPEAPTSFADYNLTDRPALSLHVVTFSDATFVTLTYPHSLTDGMGRRELVENWCRVLAGRRRDVAPMVFPTFDPMARVAAADPPRHDEPFLWEHKRLRGWGVLRFTVGVLWYLVTNRIRQRNVFIPARSLRLLRERAEQDLLLDGEKPADRLSDGDILTAWLVRLACSHIPQGKPGRPLSVSSALDLRGRLHENDMPSEFAYVTNVVAYNWTNATALELLQSKFGRAAALIRDSVRSQLTEAQIYASTRLTYEAVAESGSTSQFAEPDGFVVSVSNVSKARFHEVIDFSPAVTGEGSDEIRTTPRGKIVWQCNTPRMRVKPPCLIYIQGKDHSGNYLAQMLVSERTWKLIQKKIESMDEAGAE